MTAPKPQQSNQEPLLHTKLETNIEKPANLFRWLAAIFYDSLLAAAVILFISGAYVGLSQLAFGQVPSSPLTLQLTLFPCILASTFLFYATFWRYKGRTLGLQTWRLKLVSQNQTPITWRQCLIRFIIAWLSFIPAGLGFWWTLFHPNKLSWQDIASNTRLIDIRV